MDMHEFLNSYPGMFINQSCLHATVAALIVDRAIQGWKVSDPSIKQRFALLVVVLPVFSFPVFQMINPERGAMSFRFGALLDSARWLSLGLWKIQIGHVLFLVLLLTSIVYIFQELIPVIRHTLESRSLSIDGEIATEDSPIYAAMEGFPGQRPDVKIIEDDELVLFSTTFGRPAMYVSTGLIKTLSEEQLKAAISHEIAHIIRGKKPLLTAVFVVRSLVFFNPVALLEFRRAAREEEKICDDISVSITGNPSALAETLKLFHRPEIKIEKGLKGLGDTIEEYSHNIHLEQRVSRLRKGPEEGSGAGWPEIIATAVSITAINYFIV